MIIKRFWLTMLLISWRIAYIFEKYLDEKIYKLKYPIKITFDEIKDYEKKYPIDGFDLCKLLLQKRALERRIKIDDPIFKWWDKEKD